MAAPGSPRDGLLPRLWDQPRRRGDSLLALSLLVFAALVVREAGRLPPPFFDPLGSAAAPRFVAGLLALLALLLVARWAVTPLRPAPAPGGAADEEGTQRTPWSAVGVVLAPVLYLLAMQNGVLGFAPASALLVLALAAILGRARPRVIAISVPLALVAGYGLNALLTEFFYIDLPQQSFWNL